MARSGSLLAEAQSPTSAIAWYPLLAKERIHGFVVEILQGVTSRRS
jgi:hypothetical protein